MTTAAQGRVRPGRAWRTLRITPLGESLATGRLAATAIRLVLQVFLVTCLWRALYAQTESSAGLDREQAVTFAVAAALLTRVRGIDRRAGRDTVFQHLQFGTIVYWFLRPLSPGRYYFFRALGEQLYALAWAAAGYLVCRLFGLIEAPASVAAGLLALLSVCAGQVIVYYLMLLVDLLCFWTLKNYAAIMIITFVQNLLSGAFAPLWFFPDWFRTMSSLLPFQSTLNVPLSIYIGRIPLSDVPGEFLVQFVWAVLLAVAARVVWARAGRRVVSQGG
ncbi:ABC-2 family transporter protein [Streptomyces sp. NPDC047042]|uniref:ABC transporter permease n=1 Tax=Streptomyces sp. NPDC047042 TaxID=3154807 RepID=UPI0033E1758E